MQWIDIEQNLPPNNVYVLVANFDSRKNVGMYFIQICARFNKEWIDDHNCEKLDPKYGKITHWMPLPDAPDRATLVKAIKTSE